MGCCLMKWSAPTADTQTHTRTCTHTRARTHAHTQRSSEIQQVFGYTLYFEHITIKAGISVGLWLNNQQNQTIEIQQVYCSVLLSQDPRTCGVKWVVWMSRLREINIYVFWRHLGLLGSNLRLWVASGFQSQCFATKKRRNNLDKLP